MDERVAMDHFNGRRRAQDALAFGTEKARGLDREKRPEPLAAAKTRVAHGFEKSRRPDRLAPQDGRGQQESAHPLRGRGDCHQSSLEFAGPRAAGHCLTVLWPIKPRLCLPHWARPVKARPWYPGSAGLV